MTTPNPSRALQMGKFLVEFEARVRQVPNPTGLAFEVDSVDDLPILIEALFLYANLHGVGTRV